MSASIPTSNSPTYIHFPASMIPPASQPQRFSKGFEDQKENEEIVNRLYDEVKSSIQQSQVSATTMIVVVGQLIRIVEKTKTDPPLKGEQKKQLVIVLLTRLISELPLEADVKAYLDNIFVPLLLPSIIDNLCSLNVQSLKANLKSCCAC